jgi:hypothetical protein
MLTVQVELRERACVGLGVLPLGCRLLPGYNLDPVDRIQDNVGMLG